ncbi:lamin tail domain-containing protein, partial [Flavobacterium sp. AS60]|uniref:beta strand repeat-containing protein n=1 Tax=Flavobacterium anseongense TaxID=2910677 RepID=UPI001F41C2FF
MKLTPFLYKSLLILITLFSFQGFSQNLLNNGNFETGTVVGFFSNGAGYVRIFPPFSGTTSPGNWALTDNPQPMNTASFVASGDHTTGVGIMMVIDGNTTGGQQNFWEAGNGGSGVCGLTAGVQYTFSYWIRSVYGSVSGTPTPAVIGVQILNASAVTLVSGNLTAPPTASGWQQVVFTFIANGACANIKLYNNNTSADGNDFAVDDFSVTAPPLPLSLSYISSNPTCPATATGLITATASNGVPPYTVYNLTGAATQNNTTGVFSGLLAGNYTVSVTDSNGTTVSTNVTLVDPPGLTTSADTSICSGSPTTLTVSGGSSVYNWTANPADPTLTTPNSSNPTVSPTQTTIYTVTSPSTSNVNLISNGDFSSGNTGFISSYTYYSPANITFVQRAYGIVVNPNTWEPGFSAACVDHTTGTGPMMVVDGSTSNGGNDMVWGQNIAVNAGQNYTFSYWLQTIASGSPAIIRTVINGVLIGTANASATVCGWTQYTYVWNSGASTLAQIQLFDSNVSAGGNDFALDDISFTTTLTCNLTKNITITVNASSAPVISCGTATASSVTFNWAAVTGATGYTISYSINSGPLVNVGSIALTTYTVNGLSSGNSVQIFVTPTGVGCLAASNATCTTTSVAPCPTPTVSVTQQPTCPIPTGTIVFTSPLNPCALTLPTDLFISEVTDESTGALSYIEIFNGTGTPKNLANYKLKVYNNGNPGPSLNCDFPLSGTLNSGDVYVVSVGTVVNAGGVVPDLVVAACPGFNTNDNVRLTTIGDVEIDSWGRTDGVDFTPGNQSGYTYRRNVCAPHPSLTWAPADWAALDPQDYTDVGTYQMAIYEYSVNGTTYQSSPTFTGLAPNTYNVTIRDLISGCISTPIPLTINPIATIAPPTVNPITYCQNAVAVPLTATPSAGGTLNWYGTNATGGTASGTAPTPLTTGAIGSVVNYYVSQTIGGCESTRAVIAVTIGGNAPTATPFLFCDGANTTPTSVAFDFNNVGQTSFSYSYSIAGGPPVTGSLVAPSHFDVPVSAPGTEVTFTITWNGICTPSQTRTCYATCTTTPVLNITNPAAVCSPNTVDITAPAVTAGSTGGGTLSYWTNATATTALTNPTAIATSGTYYIKSSLGGCTDINPVVVTINPSPSLTITNPAAVCAPNTVDITLPAVTAGSTGGGTLSYWVNPAATTALANPTAIASNGTFYIKSTVGTCVDIEPVTVTINPTPVLVITNPVAVCSPNTVDITLPAVTAGSLGAGTLSYWTNAAATTALANPTSIATSGTYYIKSTLGSCSDIRPVVVTITTPPVLSITNPAAVCSPNTVNITLPAVTAGSTGGGTLSYWTNVATTTALANPTTVSASGTYYIKSTVGTCVDIEPVTVTINPTPVLSITNPPAVCSPNTVNITSPAVTSGSSGGGTLSYWTNAAATTALANPTSIATSGTYYIKSTLGTCSDIKPVLVTINPTPVLVITNPAPVCSPNTVDITLPAITAGSTGAGTLSYWTNATATTALANPTAIATSGTYYIKSTLGSCSDVEPVVVTINPTPILSVTNPAAVCSPNAVDITLPGVTTGSTGGGILSYWSDAAAATALANPTAIAASGTYYIKSTLGSCSDIEPVIVTINNPNLIITNPTTVCAPSTVDLTLPAVTAGSSGGGTLSYWTNAAATTALANPTAVAIGGTYYIKSTVGTCFDIEPVVVTITANFVVNNPLPLQKCDPNNDGFETFDLTQTINSITGGNPGYTVSFHETQVDADVAGTSIPTPANYDNINPFSQTIYIRVSSNTSTCYQVVQLQLVINPTPEATDPDAYELCDYTGAAGFETFDLTTTISDI